MVQAPPGDMLLGARAIAEYLGVTRRQALHLIEKGSLPHFRDGHSLCARRSTLSMWLAECEKPSGHPVSDRDAAAAETQAAIEASEARDR